MQKPEEEFSGRACAAVGQNGLMALYDTLLSQVKSYFPYYFISRTILDHLFFFGISLDLYVRILVTYIVFCFIRDEQLDVTSSQLLVTDNDFKNADFRVQLSQTVNSLLDLRGIPIFNENDAISTRSAPYEVCFFIFCLVFLYCRL